MIKPGMGQLKKHIKGIGVMVLIIALSLVSVPEVSANADKISELEEKIEKIKKEAQETKEDIADNKEELVSLNDTAKDLKEALNLLNSELIEIGSNLEEIEKKIDYKNAQIEELENDLTEASKIKEEQYESMKKRIKFMYEEKSYALTEGILGKARMSDYLNKTNYCETLASYDRHMLEEYENTCNVIEESKVLVDDEREDLINLKLEARGQQNRVGELVDRTNKSIDAYKDEIARTEKAIIAYEDELKAKQSDLATLQAELNEEKRLSKKASDSEWSDVSEISYADGDRKLMANIIYCEAGNQSYEGMLAVGAVVMNRVRSSVFPNTIVGVVYQSGQFTPAVSGRLALALAKNQATEECYRAADAAMAGENNIGDCLFFRTAIPGLNGIRIESHVFY